MPIALPLWFVALDRRIYVSGPATAKRVARLRRDPRVSFLVESGTRWAELRAVHLTGQARVVTEPELVARVAAALDAKYAAFRARRSAMPAATRAYYEAELATIEITPDAHILSWDNARLPPRS
jgi:nitroimidazol reductase NimA-like FMN-containing flavoprotein (pyridoxamine 5'-phosphate oxidase superfamily)